MPKKRILIVDDEAQFAKLLKMNLERTGAYEVRAENRGAMALPAAQEFKPDLVLLDLMMPDIEGGEIARQLMEDVQTKGAKVIFLTALATKSDTRSGGLIGGKPFIAKTSSADEILKAVATYLSK